MEGGERRGRKIAPTVGRPGRRAHKTEKGHFLFGEEEKGSERGRGGEEESTSDVLASAKTRAIKLVIPR